MFQTARELCFLGDPFSCDDMFGRRWNIRLQYIQGLRQTLWVDASTFFLADGDYDSYWVKIASRRYMLPDYTRVVNFDHICPYVTSGRVYAPPFSFNPTPSQYSQQSMDFSLDVYYRAYDIYRAANCLSLGS